MRLTNAAWAKISRTVLLVAKIAAWLCTGFLCLSIMGDPPPNLSLAEQAEREQHFAMAFYCFWGAWSFVILVSLWHRRARAIWHKENADVWLAAYGVEPGTRKA